MRPFLPLRVAVVWWKVFSWRLTRMPCCTLHSAASGEF